MEGNEKLKKRKHGGRYYRDVDPRVHMFMDIIILVISDRPKRIESWQTNRFKESLPLFNGSMVSLDGSSGPPRSPPGVWVDMIIIEIPQG